MAQIIPLSLVAGLIFINIELCLIAVQFAKLALSEESSVRRRSSLVYGNV